MNENDKEYQSSLKSLETENIVDRKFYRPIGFYFAKLLSHTKVTPNMVTILSIFVGLGGGVVFYAYAIQSWVGRCRYYLFGVGQYHGLH